jgi:hypothetical protein
MAVGVREGARRADAGRGGEVGPRGLTGPGPCGERREDWAAHAGLRPSASPARGRGRRGKGELGRKIGEEN